MNVFSIASDLIFGLSLYLDPYFMYATSEGSGETGCAGLSEPRLLADVISSISHTDT